MALDRLADLADQRGDLEELSDLLDEGCLRAGRLLTARAVTRVDLRELQRLSDAGCDKAGDELSRLLAAPAPRCGVSWEGSRSRRVLRRRRS
jgi:hypothetical protein